MEKLVKLTEKILYIMIAIIISLIILSRLFISVQYSIYELHIQFGRYYVFFNFYTLIFIIIILFLLFKYMNIKISNKIMYSLLLLYPIFISMMVYRLFPCELSADSLICFNIAKELAEGLDLLKAIFLYDNYLKCVPYQYGFINFCRLFIIVFSENAVLAIVIFQSILYGISNIFLYKIACVLNNKINRLIYLILNFLWIVPYVYITYVYVFSVGLSFSIISLYYFIKYIKSNRINNFLISSLFLILAVYIKQNYTILGITYCLYLIFLYKNTILKKSLSILFSVVILIAAMNSNTISSQIIDNYKLDKGIPLLAWFVMCNPDSTIIETYYNKYANPGMYTSYNLDVASQYNYDSELISERINVDLRNELKYIGNNPVRAIKYYYYKFVGMWSSYDYLINSYITNNTNNSYLDNSLDHGILNIIEGQVINVSTILILMGVILYLLLVNKAKEGLLIIIFLIGGFLYHMLFESKPIYIYPYLTLLIPLSCIGLQSMKGITVKSRINKSYFALAVIGAMALLIIIVNIKPYYVNTYCDYSDVNNSISLYDSKIIQPFIVQEDTTVNRIELYCYGKLENNSFSLEILDDNNNLLSFKEVKIEKLTNDIEWISIDIDKTFLSSGKYYLRIEGNTYDSNDFGLIYGYSSWNNEGLFYNDEFYDNNVINFKLEQKTYSRWYYYQDNRIDYLSNLYYKLW